MLWVAKDIFSDEMAAMECFKSREAKSCSVDWVDWIEIFQIGLLKSDMP